MNFTLSTFEHFLEKFIDLESSLSRHLLAVDIKLILILLDRSFKRYNRLIGPIDLISNDCHYNLAEIEVFACIGSSLLTSFIHPSTSR